MLPACPPSLAHLRAGFQPVLAPPVRALVRRGQPGRTVLPLLCALAGMALAAPPPPAPTHRELWVPEKSVAAALKTMPKAVVLTREQFDTLLRDSAAGTTADPRTPPATAILRSVRYSGTVGEKAVLIHGEFVVECLAETWAELPLELDPHWLGAVTVDGASAAVATTDQAAMLVVRGRGRHAVTIDFAVPLTESAGSRMLTLRAPGTVEATLDLTVPEALKIESALPFTRAGGTARFALPPGRDEFRISWTARDVPPLETAGIFQDSRFVYTLDAAQARADLSMLFHAALKDLPNSLALPVAAGAQVLAVEGSELARWSLAGDQLLVEFQAGSRRETDLRVLLSLPVGEAAATVELPAPVATGIHRAAGSFSLLSHPGLRVRSVGTGALTVRDDAQAPPDLRGRPDYRGTWAFPVVLTAPSVEIERLTSRFTATLDTQITLARDAIRLTRHLAFSPRDGTLFSPRVIGLLAGEQIDSVKLADNRDAVWQPVEGGLALTTPAGTAAGQSLGVTITSSLHPAGWNQLSTQPVSLAFTSAQLPGAEKVSGYVALDFDESFRVTTPRTDGLEPRDPRQFEGKLPLTGRRAWFRLDAFQLDLAVSRRAPEFDATIALDVLPLLNTLEVEGQLTLAIAHGGLREFTVTFPAAAAEAVRWESPLLAEKTLGADGKWALKFHQEMSGTPHVRFHLSLPLEDKSVAGEPERKFSTQVPFPTADAARRTDGTLVVEANSDTELAFTAQALDDLDTRRAPALDGYSPRHRLVAGYAWRGKAATLAIEGVRHKAERPRHHGGRFARARLGGQRRRPATAPGTPRHPHGRRAIPRCHAPGRGQGPLGRHQRPRRQADPRTRRRPPPPPPRSHRPAPTHLPAPRGHDGRPGPHHAPAPDARPAHPDPRHHLARSPPRRVHLFQVRYQPHRKKRPATNSHARRRHLTQDRSRNRETTGGCGPTLLEVERFSSVPSIASPRTH